MQKHSIVWPAILLCVAASIFSIYLRAHTIAGASPTFDEPFHLLQGVSLAQTGKVFTADVHPPLFWFVVSVFSPLLGDFRDVTSFSQDKDLFAGPYQYRVDAFARAPEDRAVQNLRWLSQVYMLLLLAGALGIARFLGWGAWPMAGLFVFLVLEPSLLGLSSLATNDVATLAWLLCGTWLACTGGGFRWALALIAFSAAWATKYTAGLWLAPLLAGILVGKIPFRAAWLWFGGIYLGSLIAHVIGFDQAGGPQGPANYRFTYLDGLVSLRPQLTYFLQTSVNKLSLASVILTTGAIWLACGKSRALWVTPALVVAALLASGQLLPGIGFRLTIPLFALLVFLACSGLTLLPTQRQALVVSALTLLLIGEAFWHADRMIAYQNPLAGPAPRAADSNRDWGQGLKALAEWRKHNPDGDLALSTFGGTPLETYGIESYRTLPSFPNLMKGQPIESNRFSGFVAVSENFLNGYIIEEPSLRQLARMRPVTCFQDVLCLFDVREKR